MKWRKRKPERQTPKPRTANEDLVMVLNGIAGLSGFWGRLENGSEVVIFGASEYLTNVVLTTSVGRCTPNELDNETIAQIWATWDRKGFNR